MTDSSLLLLHFASTLIMVGIIWFVQIVHYPLMAYVDVEQFCQYSEQNQRQTSWVVIGPMLVEALTAVVLVVLLPSRLLSPLFSVAFALLAVNWASTFLLQMPIHAQLLDGYDSTRIRRLVRSNWIRTIAWTTRGILIGLIINGDAMPGAS